MRPTEGRHVVRFAVGEGGEELCEAISGAFLHLQCRAVSKDAILVEAGEPVRIGPLVRFIEERGAELAEARKLRLSLEDVFVGITGIAAAAMKQEREKRARGGGE